MKLTMPKYYGIKSVPLMLHDKRVREGEKAKILASLKHTHTHTHIQKKNEEETLMTIIVLVSLTGHMVVAAVTTFSHAPFCIPFAFSKPLLGHDPLLGWMTQTFIPEGSGPMVTYLDWAVVVFH